MEYELAVRTAVERLGCKKLRAKQLEVVTSFLKGRDVFAILPTGFGKSLCYACLPFAFDSLLGRKDSVVVVITPLTAIMKDQVCYLMI